MSWFKKKAEMSGEYGSLPVSPSILPGGDALFYDTGRRCISRLPGHLTAMFARLLPWGTEDEHLRHLLAETAGDEEIVQENFREMRSLGLVISKDDFLSVLRKRTSSEPPAEPVPATSLLWCTRDRPESLMLSVSSFAAERDGAGSSGVPRLLVFDDSPADTARGALRGTHGERLVFIGRKEKTEFFNRIRRGLKGIPGPVLDFALKGHTGANRNLSLLETAGEKVLSADDDVHGTFALPRSPSGKDLEIASAFDPLVYGIFPDIERLKSSVPLHDIDIGAEHEKYLGRDVSEVVSALSRPSALELSRCAPVLTEGLLHKKGRIVITSTGIAGDSGMGAARSNLGLRGLSRETLLSGAGYTANCRARHVHRLAPHPTLTRSDHFIAAHFGMDNRSLVPPFFPRFRNSDGLFSATLLHLDPSAFICHLPFAAFHAPLEARAYPEESLTTWSPSASETIMVLTKSIIPPPGPPWTDAPEPVGMGARMKALGTGLKDVSRLPKEDFKRHLARAMLPTAVHYLGHLTGLLDEYGEGTGGLGTGREEHDFFYRNARRG